MISNNQKTSLLVPYQLPEFVRNNPDYANFVAFLQAYYEWMEQSGGVTDGSKNLTSYFDIDNTTDEFINYFINDFLPYFPEDALSSKNEAVKFAKQLYQSKGTPASYQFLFRVLYNSDFDYLNTGDTTLKASSGNWYVAKSLKLASDDVRFLQLNTNNFGSYRIFGETSKSFTTIEYVVLAGNKIEIFISDIERLFESGETVIVFDAQNQAVIINGSILSATLVGQISQINVNPNNRGLFYTPGDPVAVYGGLNPSITNPLGATAQVGTVTSGSIQQINTISGGFGYTTNSAISFTNLNSGAIAPAAHVASVTSSNVANVSLIPSDSISLKRNITIGNTRYNFSANANANVYTSLANAFNFISFQTSSISSVIVDNGGGGITSVPTITVDSEFPTDTSVYVGQLSNLGILAPIQIANGGRGYVANDTINFVGGSGYGAYANVATVNATGAITSVVYVYKPGEFPHHYPLGGMGYNNQSLPALTVTSSNSQANGASLYVPSILGTGATFSTSVNRAGSITTINIVDPGQDYISAPNISLKVQDILVSNVSISTLPSIGDKVYQGSTFNTASYYATVDSITQLLPNNNPSQSIWNLRVFDYNSQPNSSLPFKITGDTTNVNGNMFAMVSTSYAANSFFVGSPAYTNGVKNYGDGTALATAKFLNGLTIGAGQYIDTVGQPSGFSVLQSKKHNNFTYQITVNKEIEKYRQILLNLLHPAGTNLIGRYAIKSKSAYSFNYSEIINKAYTLYHYTGTAATNAVMSVSGTNVSTNILQFNNLSGANIGNIFVANTTTISLIPNQGGNQTVYTTISGVDYANNRVTLSTNTFLSFANVAYVSTNANSTTININSITNSYNIVNNGQYSNTAYPLMDIVLVGDTVTIGSNSYTVSGVNAISGTITTTTNVSTTSANTFLTVNRTFVSGGSIANANNIIVWNTISEQNFPQLTDEAGDLLITEGGDYILLG